MLRWGLMSKSACIVFFALVFCVAAHAGEKKITLSTGEWAPYTSEYMLDGGICSEIVCSAFAAAGMDTELKFYPWKRAMLNLKRGRVEGAYPWVKRNETESFALFSGPLHIQKYSFFYHKQFYPNGVSYSTFDDLMKYKIGICRGYYYGKQLSKMGLNTEVVSSSSNGIMMLMRGYIDLMTEDSVVGNYLISVFMPGREHEFGEIKTPLKSEPVYLLVSKKNPDGKELIERFDRGLAEIKKNGTYNGILKKHGLD